MPVHAARTRSIEAISPTMWRISLEGEGLAGFHASGHPDERLRLYLPPPGNPGEHIVRAASTAESARPERDLPLARRSYTVRRWDPRRHRLDIDIAMHDVGAVVDWLRQARPGHWIGVSDAVGWYAPPDDAARILIVSDATGLPAVHRITDRLQHTATATDVVLSIPHADDAADLVTAPNITYTLNDAPPDELAALAITRSRPDYLWSATEAATCSSLKQHALSVWRLRREQIEARAYWRAGRVRSD
ncbi:siderophore-interacting protein [uncultured Aeromicrobium sp.]|uniref:siderophore-interacting protein n=1 Tax=uncultured Aeromicrobium sp. TaxID=337820 RepID=UPI0025CE8A31|nr:siderophore-interacting protein [uncultured Aeromicrobium sp.]